MAENLQRPPRTPLVPPGGIDCQVRDLTVTASADVTLDAIQAQLAEHDQWVPIDGDGTATIGKLVQENSTGPLRLGFGAWRDILLGVQFLNGAGELITAGGRTMKNVAGYDLTKFMVGQRGVFGNPVALTMRTWRRPAGALLATFPPQIRLFNALLVTTCRPQWALLSADALHCGYLGDEATISYCRQALLAHKPSDIAPRTMSEDVSCRAALWGVPQTSEVKFRASLPPMKVQQLAQDASIANWIADAAFGIVLGTAARSNAPAVARAAEALGGSILLEMDGRCFTGRQRPSEREILVRLKHAFDPEGRLNPMIPPLPELQ